MVRHCPAANLYRLNMGIRVPLKRARRGSWHLSLDFDVWLNVCRVELLTAHFISWHMFHSELFTVAKLSSAIVSFHLCRQSSFLSSCHEVCPKKTTAAQSKTQNSSTSETTGETQTCPLIETGCLGPR